MHSLVHAVSSPLPRTDPDREVISPPQLSSLPAANTNEPVSLGLLQETNRALLNEFCNKLTDHFNKELKICDDYMNEVALKLNTCAATLVAVLERLSDYS